jgi:hypothetical protein
MMDDRLWTGLVSIALGILGVATLAVILSPKASTASVIGAGGTAFANDINAATGPVTGSSSNVVSLPSLTSAGAFG